MKLNVWLLILFVFCIITSYVSKSMKNPIKPADLQKLDLDFDNVLLKLKSVRRSDLLGLSNWLVTQKTNVQEDQNLAALWVALNHHT